MADEDAVRAELVARWAVRRRLLNPAPPAIAVEVTEAGHAGSVGRGADRMSAGGNTLSS